MNGHFRRAIVSCWVLSAGLGASICHGASYEDTHVRLRAANPVGLSLTLSVDKDAFFIGERIRVTLEYRNTSERQYQVSTRSYDRSGRLFDIEFHVEGPEHGFVDPLALYFASNGGLGGGLSSAATLLGQCSQSFDLNEWVRFDRPGDYRVYCTTSRVETTDGPRKNVPLCSQIVTLEIAKPDDTWRAAQVRSALDALKSAEPNEQLRAARMLRFLAEPQAMGTLVSLLGQADLSQDAFFGLVGTRDPSAAREALLRGIRQPDTVVTHTYLRALAVVSAVPEGPIVPYDSADGEALRQQYDRLQAAQKAALKDVLEQLSAALPAKRGRAKAASCVALIARGSDSPGLRETLAGTFTQLTDAEQRAVLERHWARVRCAAFKDPLEEILSVPATYEEWYSRHIRSWALCRYLDVQPEKARNLILEDLRRARPLSAGRALLALPDESLPEMDEVFAAHLAQRGVDDWKLMPLIERYATERILPDVIARYQKNEGMWACSMQESLLRYWIKHDPNAGLAAVRRAALLREHTGCYRMVLGNVLSRYYGPAAESLALSFLDDKDNEVVLDVVRLLERKGSAAIIDPLFTHLANMNADDEPVAQKGMFSNASIHMEIIGCLLAERDWQLTEGQRRRLYGLLRSDAERARFARRFPDVPREQTQ